MSGVSEQTAALRRIADALERLAKVMEGDPVIPPMPTPEQNPTVCFKCGCSAGYHWQDCPLRSDA